MSRNDWYRNTTWDPEIEAAFEAKLSRARTQRSQYLRIQGRMLAHTHPDVALRLLDRYFETGDHFDMAQAYIDQAQARLALGDPAGAVESYEAALAREVALPTVRTPAFLLLALLVAEQGMTPHFPRAVELLEQRRGECLFPVQRFLWHAAQALILASSGRAAEASVEARHALTEAAVKHPVFANHPKVGLVGDDYPELRERLALLASA